MFCKAKHKLPCEAFSSLSGTDHYASATTKNLVPQFNRRLRERYVFNSKCGAAADHRIPHDHTISTENPERQSSAQLSFHLRLEEFSWHCRHSVFHGRQFAALQLIWALDFSICEKSRIDCQPLDANAQRPLQLEQLGPLLPQKERGGNAAFAGSSRPPHAVNKILRQLRQ